LFFRIYPVSIGQQHVPFRFVDGLDNRIMTSTASRLSIVQREIENLEFRLNPNPDARIRLLGAWGPDRGSLGGVCGLGAGRGGSLVLKQAVIGRGVREVYTLSMGLRNGSRCVGPYRAGPASGCGRPRLPRGRV